MSYDTTQVKHTRMKYITQVMWIITTRNKVFLFIFYQILIFLSCIFSAPKLPQKRCVHSLQIKSVKSKTHL